MRGENRGGEQCFGYINFLHTFNRDYFFAKFSHLFAKQIEAKFREIFFTFFARERNAKIKRNGREQKKFAKLFFLFAGNPQPE